MAKKMEEITWWHQVPLDDGRITPGRTAIYKQEPTYMFDEINFVGKSVLDIGAWDGYFTFMAEKRGATRVVSIDNPEFRWGGLDGYNFLHEHFKSSAEWQKGTVYKLPDEMFDIVLCYGVLYHLSDPLLATMNCFQKAKELVVFESVMYEGEKAELTLLPCPYYGDPSNVFTLSSGFIKLVASQCGFELVKYVQTAKIRGTMMFKAVKKTPCPYRLTTFTFPPGVGK